MQSKYRQNMFVSKQNIDFYDFEKSLESKESISNIEINVAEIEMAKIAEHGKRKSQEIRG